MHVMNPFLARACAVAAAGVALSTVVVTAASASAGGVPIHRGASGPGGIVAGGGGALRLTRMLPHGAALTMQRAEPGAIVAETSLFADRYCCNAIAAETSLIRVVRIQAVRAALRNDSILLWEWLRHMAGEVQQARARAEILSLKTVAHRVEGWRALNDGVLPPRGRWRQLADEIGVSPEALYREFARRG